MGRVWEWAVEFFFGVRNSWWWGCSTRTEVRDLLADVLIGSVAESESSLDICFSLAVALHNDYDGVVVHKGFFELSRSLRYNVWDLQLEMITLFLCREHMP
jgi:hypothetical protein